MATLKLTVLAHLDDRIKKIIILKFLVQILGSRFLEIVNIQLLSSEGLSHLGKKLERIIVTQVLSLQNIEL